MNFEEYAKKCRINLGKSLKERKKIYLDTKYWIELCDASLYKTDKPLINNIFSRCKDLVEKKIVIFPISYRIFIEVIKQTDEKTLMETIKIIDLLSEGVTILAEDERINYEILNFLYSNHSNQFVYELDIFVWSKMSYVMGMFKPQDIPLISKEENIMLQNHFFDYVWNISLSEMIKTMTMKNVKKFPKAEDISTILTKGKQEAVNENSSLHAIYMSEIAGILDVYREKISYAMKYLYQKENTEKKEKLSSDIQPILNLFYGMFEQNKIGNLLPSWDIMAKLHASIRLDNNRKYRPHDLNDIGHICTALPYFDYLFTERSFGTLIQQIKYDSKYKCTVAWKPEDVLQCLLSFDNLERKV